MSEEDQKYIIPRYLDEPMRIILWTWDELTIFLLPIILTYWLSNELIFGMIIGVSAFFCLKKIKGNQGHYFVKSLVYWYLPEMTKFHKTPPSYIREYIG